MTGTNATATRQRSIHHEAYFYRGLEQFLTDTLRFIDDAPDDTPILIAVEDRKIRALRSRLGPSAAAVEFLAMADAGRNPGRLISAWHDFLARHPGRPVRGVGEPLWAGRSPAEVLECQSHEHLLNHAFAHGPDFWLRCPYDTEALPVTLLEEAARSHPYLCRDGSTTRSHRYTEVASSELLGAPLDPVPAQAVATIIVTSKDLRSLRDELTAAVATAGFDRRRRDDVLLVVSELAANSLRHASGPGTVRAWDDGAHLFVQVDDDGHIADPLVGRRRPDPETPTGRGVWLAHELADLVQLRSGPLGTTVRVTFDHRR